MTFVTANNSTQAALPADRSSWLDRLDPRNSIGAATGWLITAVSLGLALAASTWVSTVASDTLLAQKYKQLNQYAERLSSQLDITLYGYLQSVRATAAILGAVRRIVQVLSRVLERRCPASAESIARYDGARCPPKQRCPTTR